MVDQPIDAYAYVRVGQVAVRDRCGLWGGCDRPACLAAILRPDRRSQRAPVGEENRQTGMDVTPKWLQRAMWPAGGCERCFDLYIDTARIVALLVEKQTRRRVSYR
jgi:hypothetical protein